MKVTRFTELPPRARRIQNIISSGLGFHGTTSACAENTRCYQGHSRAARNYLRVRGEYRLLRKAENLMGELPPRARRILEVWMDQLGKSGTTSACAENTCFVKQKYQGWRNYLRVRGEYLTHKRLLAALGELPPRARRIRPQDFRSWGSRGTTSACAENTIGAMKSILLSGNYLRVRGEYQAHQPTCNAAMELPPRARRIPGLRKLFKGIPGTTSACAENTDTRAWVCIMKRNYLRVRGEYPPSPHRNENPRELPPRARRIP